MPPNSAAFDLRGPSNLLFGTEMKSIQIRYQYGAKHSCRDTQFGRKHPETLGKAVVYDLGVCPNSIIYCEPFNQKN